MSNMNIISLTRAGSIAAHIAVRRPLRVPPLGRSATGTSGKALRSVCVRGHDAAHDAELQLIAQAEYGREYTELDATQRQHCAGVKGALHRWANQPTHPTDPELQRIAQTEFGMDYQDLGTEQRLHCAGIKGSSHRWAGHQHHGPEDDPELQKIAQAEFGMAYQDLSTSQRQHCAGVKGAAHHWAGHEAAQHVPRSYSDPELQAIAQYEFGKPYEELGTHDKRHCAGVKGMAHVRGYRIPIEGIAVEPRERAPEDAAGSHYHELPGPEHHNVAPLAGPDGEQLMREHPELVSYEQHDQHRHVGTEGMAGGGMGASGGLGPGGGVGKEELEAVAEEEFVSRYEDLSPEQRDRVGRLAGSRVTEELGPESGPMSSA